jgi:hypothetical protein
MSSQEVFTDVSGYVAAISGKTDITNYKLVMPAPEAQPCQVTPVQQSVCCDLHEYSCLLSSTQTPHQHKLLAPTIEAPVQQYNQSNVFSYTHSG